MQLTEINQILKWILWIESMDCETDNISVNSNRVDIVVSPAGIMMKPQWRNNEDEGIGMTLFYKNITIFFFLWKGLNLLQCERDRQTGRWRPAENLKDLDIAI